MEKKAYDAALEEYFAKGGKVTVCPVNERTEDLVINIWKRGPGRPTKKQAEKADNEDSDGKKLYVQ